MTGNPIDDSVHPQLKEKHEKIAEKPSPNLFHSDNDCSSDDNSVVGKESECNSGVKNYDHHTTVGGIRPGR